MSAGIVAEVARSRGALLAPLTVEQYRAMMRAGILREGASIELIDGLLVSKDRRDSRSPGMTVGARHSYSVRQMDRTLTRLAEGFGFHVRSQQPVTLTEIDEPEPDASVVRGSINDYRERHPGPEDVVLVVEVADSSLTFDRTTKQRLYSIAGIPAYSVVDLTANRIECYSLPNAGEGRYESVVRYGTGDAVPFMIGSQELELSVSDIL
jgi:Uma2 family endonuclease